MVQELEAKTKECPFCSEEIKVNAKKCKHCGEILDIALRAAHEAKKNAMQTPNVFMNAGGGGAAASASSSSSSNAGLVARANFPHGWHLFLSLITAGAWTPIWILHYIFRNRS